MTNKLLEMKNITKEFPGVLANDRINFDLFRGEVHSLLGENGAGKSTLMNILSGLYEPSAGEIFIDGEKVGFDSPKDAIDKGVGMVYQHFMLVPPLTVVENIILGMNNDRNPLLKTEEAAKNISELSKRFGMEIDPYKKIEELSVGEQQRVEIIKALYRGSEILILDEPTAVLTPQESEELFDIIDQLKSEDHAIIFINHKIEEVKKVSDRITVLRDGKKIDTVSSKTTKKELAKMMVGRKVIFNIDKKDNTPGEAVLELKNVKYKSSNEGYNLEDISFKVFAGEILGLAGIDGNGQTKLVEAITGLRKVDDGDIILKNKNVTNKDPKEILDENVAFIPGNRQLRGLVLDMDLRENLILRDYYCEPHCKGSFLDWNYINDHSSSLIEKYDVRTPSKNVEAEKLSGGNQQKLILARELHMDPDLLIAMHPTRGLDVGAIEYVQEQILKQKANDTAILYVSTEIQEVINISDRLAVICGGELMGIVDPEKVNIEDIGLMMAGTKKKKIFQAKKE